MLHFYALLNQEITIKCSLSSVVQCLMLVLQGPPSLYSLPPPIKSHNEHAFQHTAPTRYGHVVPILTCSKMSSPQITLLDTNIARVSTGTILSFMFTLCKQTRWCIPCIKADGCESLVSSCNFHRQVAPEENGKLPGKVAS